MSRLIDTNLTYDFLNGAYNWSAFWSGQTLSTNQRRFRTQMWLLLFQEIFCADMILLKICKCFLSGPISKCLSLEGLHIQISSRGMRGTLFVCWRVIIIIPIWTISVILILSYQHPPPYKPDVCMCGSAQLSWAHSIIPVCQSVLVVLSTQVQKMTLIFLSSYRCSCI